MGWYSNKLVAAMLFNETFCYNIYRKRKEVFYMNNFDDFDLYPQVEEFYDDAEYWEAIMNEEVHNDEE